ncbi:MAG: hypothetical protein KGL35_07890 [Bradyrhizobium sp.]|nr:hypothetical protein [Pseudomonadota bacterium]MDE2468650.1 hypothetical protein [Bradyrhizobium sp.]
MSSIGVSLNIPSIQQHVARTEVAQASTSQPFLRRLVSFLFVVRRLFSFAHRNSFMACGFSFSKPFRGLTKKPAASFFRRGGLSSGASVVEVSLSKLLEESVDIAWVYLQRTSELGDGNIAARFLTDRIDAMIRTGQRNRMFLANMAIIKYRQSRDSVVRIREDA